MSGNRGMRKARVAFPVLASLLRGSERLTFKSDLPVDVKVESVTDSFSDGGAIVYLSSETWDDFREIVPEIEITISTKLVEPF